MKNVTRLLSAAALVLLANRLPASAQSADVSVSFTVSPSPRVSGGFVWTLTVTNHGDADTARIRADILGVTGQAEMPAAIPGLADTGWSVIQHACCGEGAFNEFVTERLPAGRTAVLIVSENQPWSPGTSLRAEAQVSSARPGFGSTPIAVKVLEVVVPGSASPPTAASQLFAKGAPSPEASGSIEALTYDPALATYVISSLTPCCAGASIGAVFADQQGTWLGTTNTLETSSTFQSLSLRVAFSPDLASGSAVGGFMYVWQQDGAIHVRPRFPPNLAGPQRTTVSNEEYARAPAIAYSPTSRVFLAVWLSCSPGCRVLARRIGLDAQPIGGAIAVSVDTFSDGPSVAWNPVTDQFGVAYRSSEGGNFSRVTPQGALVGITPVDRARSFDFIDVPVNTRSGNYVVLWRSTPDFAIETSTFAAEISSTGHVVSRGLVSSSMVAEALAFNPVSRTFLAVGGGRVVELNQHGAPLSPSASGNPGFGTGVVASRPDVPEWLVSTNGRQTQVIGTHAANGGSDLRLGGCTTPDPFAAGGGGVCFGGGWLPQGIPAPGAPPPMSSTVAAGCLTPDPFTALGGGQCASGGWFPPGAIIPSAPTTPVVPATPVGCATPDPFIALGGGACQNGGWLPPGIATPASPAPTPTSGGCTTPDPFAAIGGGICANGGWRPKG